MTGHGIAGEATIDWPALMRFKRTFTDPAPAKHETAFEKAGVVTYHGSARFKSEASMIVTTADTHDREVEYELEAKHFVIASGAEPVTLGIPGEEHVRTSTDFLDLDELPARIAFIGAGYISFEFAHIAQRAGAQAIVLGRGAPLGHFDQDLVALLVRHSRSVGIDIRTDAGVASVEKQAEGYRVRFVTNGSSQSVDVDLVVHGAGRIPKTKQLELSRANVTVDERESVTVNEFLQSTTNARVYAAGDVASSPGSLPLTPVAGYEGRVAAENLLHGNRRRVEYGAVPSVVFTIPPLATVGLTEAAASAAGLDVRVERNDTSGWYANRRIAADCGMTKVLVDRATDLIVGAHLLGHHAEDTINLFAMAMRFDIFLKSVLPAVSENA